MSIEFYERNAEDFFRRSVDLDMAPGWQAFTGLLAPGARVLDAGCGSGRDALALHRLGFQVTAIEASENLAALARAHTGLPVQVMTFDQIAWRERFDGVWACASLLHVPRTQLPATLRRIRDTLTPGGILWMSFKFGTEERKVEGRHFTDMDEPTTQRLLDDAGGLALIEMEISDDGRPERVGERWLSVLCRRS